MKRNTPPPSELLKMKLVDFPEIIERGHAVEFTMQVTNNSDQEYWLLVGVRITILDDMIF